MISLRRCIIITSFQSAKLKDFFDFQKEDFIICADGGFLYAKSEEIMPNVLIGDFDSINGSPEELTAGCGCEIIRLAAEKDDTDTMICLKYGIEHGYEEFFVLGGLGGRLDHTVANLQTISYAIDQNKSVWFFDGKNKATIRPPGEFTLDNSKGFKLSLFAFTERCEGVCISGVKYPLHDYLLDNSFPLGVSNEFYSAQAAISHKSGKLLIILSQD